MKIICLKYGEALYPHKKLVADITDDSKIPLSFCFYLILTENKKILVDTGCDGLERYKMYVYKKPLDLLAEYGLSPEDITDVIITHCHFDHIDNIASFKGAKIHIQEYEFERAKDYLDPEYECNVFEDSTEVCENIRVQKIGGHTKGSCVVFAGKYILCGDEAYNSRNFKDKIRIGNCYSKEIAQEFVEKYSDSQFIPLLLHDFNIMPKKVGFEEIN